tara:strand:- start:2697 stop:2939 length:243 start_codon:yes stop_codon:yes gene_type:complete
MATIEFSIREIWLQGQEAPRYFKIPEQENIANLYYNAGNTVIDRITSFGEDIEPDTTNKDLRNTELTSKKNARDNTLNNT